MIKSQGTSINIISSEYERQQLFTDWRSKSSTLISKIWHRLFSWYLSNFIQDVPCNLIIFYGWKDVQRKIISYDHHFIWLIFIIHTNLWQLNQWFLRCVYHYYTNNRLDYLDYDLDRVVHLHHMYLRLLVQDYQSNL